MDWGDAGVPSRSGSMPRPLSTDTDYQGSKLACLHRLADAVFCPSPASFHNSDRTSRSRIDLSLYCRASIRGPIPRRCVSVWGEIPPFPSPTLGGGLRRELSRPRSAPRPGAETAGLGAADSGHFGMVFIRRGDRSRSGPLAGKVFIGPGSFPYSRRARSTWMPLRVSR